MPNGNTLYVFGTRQVPPNESLLTALGNMYLNREGGLADALLYNFYNSSNIGIYVNTIYAPSLYVSKFNGGNSVVAIPAKASLSPQANNNFDISLCAWYEIHSMTYNGLITKGWSGPSSGNVPEFVIDPNGAYQGFALFSASNVVIASNDVGPITASSLGKWYFSCFTYNRTTPSSYYYLNAVPYSALVNGGLSPSGGTGALVFGSGMTAQAASGYSNVSMADVQLYDSNLSLQQVQTLYYRGMYGMPFFGPNLVGWWPLLGDANDYGGTGNIGFANNVAYTNVATLPGYMANSYELDKATLPMQLSNNGIYGNYNVSVVIWSG